MIRLQVIFLITLCLGACNKEPELTSLSANNGVRQTTQIDWSNISAVTRDEYKSLSSEEKTRFKESYLNQFKTNDRTDNGGGNCECTAEGCSCSVTCDSGTKPKCQCSDAGCDCGCEPFGRIAIQMKYKVEKAHLKSDTYLLEELDLPSTLDNYSKSNFENSKAVLSLLASTPSTLELSRSEYMQLENDIHSLVSSYTMKQIFAMEYEF